MLHGVEKGLGEKRDDTTCKVMSKCLHFSNANDYFFCYEELFCPLPSTIFIKRT